MGFGSEMCMNEGLIDYSSLNIPEKIFIKKSTMTNKYGKNKISHFKMSLKALELHLTSQGMIHKLNL